MTTYPSKIDWWLGLILLGLPFVGIPMISEGLGSEDPILLWSGIGTRRCGLCSRTPLCIPMTRPRACLSAPGPERRRGGMCW